MLTRRLLLQSSAAGLVSALASTGTAFANAPTDNRLVFIFLRGGLDGLHALPPYADSDYRRLRPSLAVGGPIAQSGTIDLDGYFGMHVGLTALHPLYRAGELLFVPAAATQYRDRSHFDGQNMLENGSGKPFGARDGWLNRAILALNHGDRRLGLALGPSIPLILQGDGRIQTWSQNPLPEVDEDFLMRLGYMYQSDPLFLDALHDATGALKPDAAIEAMADDPNQSKNFSLSARAAADLLAHPDGPRIAVMEMQGWDTHFRQNPRLTNLLKQLSQGIIDLKQGLGDHWQKTTVMVVSEFGRTAAENANRGTDHGTGGLAMLAGGAVHGGRIAGKWPGLSPKALYEDRDLRAVNDYESLFKTLLIDHMGLDQAIVEDRVFPNSGKTKPMGGLLL